MRVGILTSFPDGQNSKSAIAYYAKTLLEPLSGIGDELVVFADRSKPSDRNHGSAATANEEQRGNIRVIRCWRFGPWAPFSILGALLRYDVDVLHVEYDVYLYGGVVAAILLPIVLSFLKRCKRFEVTTTLHGVVSQRTVTSDFLKENGFVVPFSRIGRLGFRLVYRLFDKASDRIIVLERSLAENLRDDYQIRKSKIFIVPLPLMNLRPLPDPVSARLRTEITGDKVVAFVGYASYYKGLPILLDAYESLRKKRKDIRLCIVAGKHPRLAGNEKYERFYDGLRRRARELGARFYGFLPDEELSDILACCSVVVLPYTAAYGGSAALNTALAAHKPVLVSSMVHFEGALPAQVFEPSARACELAITAFFESYRSEIEAAVGTQVSKRTVDPIALANHAIRVGDRHSSSVSIEDKEVAGIVNRV